MKTRGLPTLRP